MLKTEKYSRKKFDVDAVQITADNMQDVVEWANGDIRDDGDGVKYIHIRVSRPINDRQTRAFIGDWVLYAGTGYKVYTNKAFHNSFEPTAVEPSA